MTLLRANGRMLMLLSVLDLCGIRKVLKTREAVYGSCDVIHTPWIF